MTTKTAVTDRVHRLREASLAARPAISAERAINRLSISISSIFSISRCSCRLRSRRGETLRIRSIRSRRALFS